MVCLLTFGFCWLALGNPSLLPTLLPPHIYCSPKDMVRTLSRILSGPPCQSLLAEHFLTFLYTTLGRIFHLDSQGFCGVCGGVVSIMQPLVSKKTGSVIYLSIYPQGLAQRWERGKHAINICQMSKLDSI
jgi:hypothetical protein